MSDVLDITEQLQKMADLTSDVDVIVTGMKAIDEISRLRAENEKLRERLEKAHSFISRADWMLFFEEEHAAATALKETGDE